MVCLLAANGGGKDQDWTGTSHIILIKAASRQLCQLSLPVRSVRLPLPGGCNVVFLVKSTSCLLLPSSQIVHAVVPGLDVPMCVLSASVLCYKVFPMMHVGGLFTT